MAVQGQGLDSSATNLDLVRLFWSFCYGILVYLIGYFGLPNPENL